jgi:hypothetical protein
MNYSNESTARSSQSNLPLESLYQPYHQIWVRGHGYLSSWGYPEYTTSATAPDRGLPLIGELQAKGINSVLKTKIFGRHCGNVTGTS